jgi:hypothetical protein
MPATWCANPCIHSIMNLNDGAAHNWLQSRIAERRFAAVNAFIIRDA